MGGKPGQATGSQIEADAIIGALMASTPNGEARVRARYWIETAYPLQQAAETMAGEQSTGTFIRVPGETDELRERHAAQVEAILELESVSTPSLPGAGAPKGK